MASYSKRSDIEEQFEKKLAEAGISWYDLDGFFMAKKEVSELLDDDEKIGPILLVKGKWGKSKGKSKGESDLDLLFSREVLFSDRLPFFSIKMLWIITDTRLVIAASNHSIASHYMFYSDIRSVDYSDKLFSGNSGTLTIEVATHSGFDSFGKKFVFEELNKDQGRKLAAFLKSAAEIGIKIGKLLKQITAENVSAPSSSEVITMLEELGSLKKQGLITDGEFQRAKSELMKRG